MATIQRFEDIAAWRKARDLAKSIYQATSTGKFARDFALRDQIRRAAVSVMSNIAEGFERGGDKEFLQFLALAKGSCGEIRAQIYIASDQGYLSPELFQAILTQAMEESRMIAGLMRYLRQSELKGSKYK